MPYSNFPGGFADGLTIRGLPVTTANTGKVFWVYNGTALQAGQRGGSDGNKGTYDSPFSTIDYAIGQCVANRGDIIMVKAGHAETLATASAITADIAGVSIIGLGAGAARPTLTFSDTASTMVISAASVTVQNIIAKPSIDSVVSPIVVSGADCWLDCEHQDESSTVEAVRAILTTATANRLHVNLVYRGFTGGNAVVNAVRLVGCDDGDINVDFYGVASTGVVEFLTTACTNVKVTGTFYNSGTTDGSKNVIDTVTGSTWYAEVVDAAAGATYTGGSAAALASDDVTAITNALYGAAGIATFPASALPANGVSLAEVVREAYDQGDKSVTNTTAALVNGTTIFTVAGGPIEILSLVARCVTTNDATASTLQWSADPTDGAAVTFSGASATLANAAAGAMVILQGTTLATAPVVNASGVGLGQGTTNGIVVGAGIITTTVGVGSTTGTWQHHLRYRPLSRGVTVS